MFETYVKRLERLEKIAMDFSGVERCFAVQAGREVRVMVQPEKISDEEMAQISERCRLGDSKMSCNILDRSRSIVIRETRAIDFAR